MAVMTLEEFIARRYASQPKRPVSTRDGYWERDLCGNWELSDEYYEKLGEYIEKHPIHTPRARRG